MWFQDFAKSLLSELKLPNKPLPRQKLTVETFSDTPLPVSNPLFEGQKHFFKEGFSENSAFMFG